MLTDPSLFSFKYVIMHEEIDQGSRPAQYYQNYQDGNATIEFFPRHGSQGSNRMNCTF
jgi:hypothetical protein